MGLPRRQFTKEFKEAAVQRVELGASVAEVARSCEVTPEDLRRWRRDVFIYGSRAFLGSGKNRVDESLIKPRTRSVVFRVTEDEYENLKSACLTSGARSISNFTR